MAGDGAERRGPGVDVASEDDAAWFEANADRVFRLRNRIGGEYEAHQVDLPPPGMTPRTLVVQAQPGVRIRMPVSAYANVSNDGTSDAELFVFFEEVASLEMRETVAKLRKVSLAGKPNRD